MRMKASATIEAAVACSVFFLSFFLVIRGVFYYHDKNILMGTAYEAAVVHSQKKEVRKLVLLRRQSSRLKLRQGKGCCYFQQ